MSEQYVGDDLDHSLEAPAMAQYETAGSSANVASDRFSLLHFNRQALIWVVIIVAILFATATTVYLLTSPASHTASSGGSNTDKSVNFKVGPISLNGINESPLQLSQANHLAINGQLTVNNGIVLNPSSAPTTGVAGQLYYDQTTNKPYYYNGTQFVSLSPTPPQSVASLGNLIGLTTTGNTGVSSSPTLAVTYGSTANTAAQGNTTFACPTGTGNLTGGGNTITVGAGGACSGLSVINNPTFTGLVTANGGLSVGSATVLGKANFSDGTTDGFVGTIQLAGAITANQTYSLPTTGGTFCLSTNNCNNQAAGNYELTTGTDFIRNQTSLQTAANFNIQSAAAASVGGIIRGAAGQTADLLQIQNSAGTVLSKFDANGNLVVSSTGSSSFAGSVGIGTTSPTATLNVIGNTIFQSAVNSTTAFQVQNATGTDVFNINSTGNGVISAGLTSGNYLQFQGAASGSAPTISSAGLDTNVGLNLVAKGTGTILATGSTVINPTNLQASSSLAVVNAAASQVATVIQGAAGQTANLLQIQNSAGTILAKIDANGNIQTSGQLMSTVATGTAPLTVASTTLVTNLNADMVDGQHASAFAPVSGSGNYIQNTTVQQAGANFNISGSGTIGTVLTVQGAGSSSFAGSLGIGIASPTSVLTVKAVSDTAATLSLLNPDGTSALEIRTGGAGNANTYIGLSSGISNTTGMQNTATGAYALQNNTTGNYNTASGAYALQANTTGRSNTASGLNVLYSNTTGNNNTSTGNLSLYSNTTGYSNAASGYLALRLNTTGYQNTASGGLALYANTTGFNNSALGYSAGYKDSGGNFATTATLQNATAIGAYAQVQASNSIVLGSIDTPTNVGIGTTIPLNTFSVSPVDYSTGTASQSTTTVTGVGTTWTAAMVGEQFIFANGSTGTITAFTSATSLTLSTSQTVAAQAYRIHHIGLQVTSGGNVGIGTSSPGKNLDVVGEMRVQNGSYPKYHLDATGNGVDLKKWQAYVGPSGDYKLAALNDAETAESGYMVLTRGGSLNVQTGYQIAGGAAAGSFLRGNGTNFVSSTIQAADLPAGSGNYIQNTTTQQPSANFNISGSGTLGGPLTVNSTATVGNNGTGDLLTIATANTANSSGGLLIQSLGAGSAYLRYDRQGSWAGKTYIGNNASTTSNAPSTAITIDGTSGVNLVGIGTTTPAYPLDVAGTAQFSNNVLVGGGVAQGLYGDNTNLAIRGYSAANAGFYIQANGGSATPLYAGLTGTYANRIGVNTQTPGFSLDVQGTANVSGVLGVTQIQAQSTLGDKISLWGSFGSPYYGFGIQSSLLQIHTDLAGSDIAFGYGTSAAFTETMRIQGNGKVGIGTAAPSGQLQVVSSSASMVGLIVKAAASATADIIQIQNSAGTVIAKVTAGGYFSGANLTPTDFTVSCSKQNNLGLDPSSFARYTRISPSLVSVNIEFIASVTDSGNWRLNCTGLPVPRNNNISLPASMRIGGTYYNFIMVYDSGLWWPLANGQTVAVGYTGGISAGDVLYVNGTYEQ